MDIGLHRIGHCAGCWSAFREISLILGNATQCGRLRSAQPRVHTCPGGGMRETHLPSGLLGHADSPRFISHVSVHSLQHRVQGQPEQTDFQKHLVSNCTSQALVSKKLLEAACLQSKRASQERGRPGLFETQSLAGMGYRGSRLGCGHQDTSRHARLAGTWVITCLLSPESWTSSWCLQKCSHRPALESWRWAAVCAEGGGAEQPCHGPASRGSCPPPGRLSQAATQMLEGSACPAALSSPGHHCPSLLLLVCR